MASLACFEPALAPRVRPSLQMCHDPALAPRIAPSSKDFHEVWEGNFDEEFSALLEAVMRAGGPQATLAMDMEFPGFLCEDPRHSSHAAHYQALRCNVDQLWPIQLGIAVLGTNGMHRGVWTFNLRFDASIDAHTKESVAFLQAAGIDFPRHRSQGINVLALGERLAKSSIIGALAPSWLTFSGSYDWAYLLKLVTLGRALPSQPSTFEKVLSVYCPKRRELRNLLPTGSLEVLGRKHGVKRCGKAHTAGSDALLTLELFVLLGGPKLELDGELGRMQEEEPWGDVSWNNTEEWYPVSGDAAQWYSGDSIQTASEPWGSSTWISPSMANDDWYSMPNKSSTWYTSGFQPWTAAFQEGGMVMAYA